MYSMSKHMLGSKKIRSDKALLLQFFLKAGIMQCGARATHQHALLGIRKSLQFQRTCWRTTLKKGILVLLAGDTPQPHALQCRD